MKYQAVITDLDGTALHSPDIKVASERLAAAVAALEAKNVKVCAATGRGEAFAKPVLGSMGLVQPAIISGGTRIVEPKSGEELWRCGLSAEQLREVTAALANQPYGFLWNDYDEAAYLDGGWPLKEFITYDDTYFFEICFVPHAEVPALLEKLQAIPDLAATVVVAQRPGMNDIHVTNARATKEHAIYELEKLIGVPKSAMIGIGDGHNDIHLFNAVGHKVAMGNAVAELKALADEVIGTVQEDGLAKYFETLAKETN